MLIILFLPLISLYPPFGGSYFNNNLPSASFELNRLFNSLLRTAVRRGISI
ncbi:MAG: hypothetical protein ACTS4X_00430 [Candidatus Hodgkinia cicadicola]